MNKITTSFSLYGGDPSTYNQSLQKSPAVALTVGYHKRNQKKIRRMRRQGLKV